MERLGSSESHAICAVSSWTPSSRFGEFWCSPSRCRNTPPGLRAAPQGPLPAHTVRVPPLSVGGGTRRIHFAAEPLPFRTCRRKELARLKDDKSAEMKLAAMEKELTELKEFKDKVRCTSRCPPAPPLAREGCGPASRSVMRPLLERSKVRARWLQPPAPLALRVQGSRSLDDPSLCLPAVTEKELAGLKPGCARTSLACALSLHPSPHALVLPMIAEEAGRTNQLQGPSLPPP
jgi:hypothetical protein